jgi:alpha/beta superfamily hydrolase
MESDKDSEKYIELAERFSNDFAVLRFDFRGCGESEGKFSDIDGRYADLIAAIGFVRELGIARIGLLGSSLGGCLSILAGAEEEIGAVVTWSAVSRFPGGFDAIEAIRKMTCPILIIHGNKDMLVGEVHARDLYENAKAQKELRIIEGARHAFEDPKSRKEAIELSFNWFKRFMK